MKKSLIILILFISTLSGFAQVQRCGYPNYRPRNAEANMFIDTCGRLSYLWSGSVWYCQNNIIQDATPAITITTSGIISSNAKISWYKTSTNTWYDAVNGAWRSRTALAVDSLLYAHNVWFGKNTFKDSLIAEKGLDSRGLIKTKGLNSTALITTKGLTSDSMVTSVGVKTSGTSTKAASENNGVQKDAVVEVTANTTLDGTFNTVVGNTASQNIVLTLPAVSAENNGWIYTISKKGTSSFNVRVTASGFNHVIISPNSPVKIRNAGGVWQVE